MMNLNTISALFLSVLVGASADLNTEAKSPVEINSASQTNEVVIDDFSAEIYNWWTGEGEKYTLKKTDDEELEVKIKDAGNPAGTGDGYHCFGRAFDAVDFSQTPVLKLTMKVDAGSPKVRINLKDATGMVNNAKAVEKTVAAGGKFVEYYYDFTDKWTQEWPDKGEVDSLEIVELLVFVSPGGPSYTGTLVIDDITAVTVAEMPKE